MPDRWRSWKDPQWIENVVAIVVSGVSVFMMFKHW